METNSQEKKAKVVKASSHGAIRVRKETRKRILADIGKVNKKDYGKKVRVDEYVTLALSLVRPEHIQALQEGSLSNADRLTRDYKTYTAKHGPMSKDEYLGKRLTGEIAASPDVSPDSENNQKAL